MSGTSSVAFALLDDPIQNMDDFNVLGLLDLLRGLIGERQFVVSTHDEQIGELLRRKLRPLAPGGRTILHKFLTYRGDGPAVETLIDDYVEAPRVLGRGGRGIGSTCSLAEWGALIMGSEQRRAFSMSSSPNRKDRLRVLDTASFIKK
jgi:hypothetical protein